MKKQQRNMVKWNVGGQFPSLNYDEFEESCKKVIDCLSMYGKVGSGDSDFFMVEDLYGDRTHKLYVCNTDKFSKRIVDHLREVLANGPVSWRMVVVREPWSPWAMWIYPDGEEYEFEELIIASTFDELIRRWRGQ